ncbi:MAG: adenylyltransferase/cytidyltransferase family protein [Candidatus Micrarchaeota archaeon]
MQPQFPALKKLYLQTVIENGLSLASFSKLNAEDKKLLEKKHEKYFLSSEYRKLFTVVLTGGVFDIIHPGHIFTLKEARKYGDILIAVIATDETVKKAKKREPLHPANERCELVNSIKYVDLAIVGASKWQDSLHRVSPNIVVFGYDQKEMDISDVKIVKLGKFVENSKTGIVRNKLGL